MNVEFCNLDEKTAHQPTLNSLVSSSRSNNEKSVNRVPSSSMNTAPVIPRKKKKKTRIYACQ